MRSLSLNRMFSTKRVQALGLAKFSLTLNTEHNTAQQHENIQQRFIVTSQRRIYFMSKMKSFTSLKQNEKWKHHLYFGYLLKIIGSFCDL